MVISPTLAQQIPAHNGRDKMINECCSYSCTAWWHYSLVLDRWCERLWNVDLKLIWKFRHADRLTLCLLDRCFGGVDAAGQSIPLGRRGSRVVQQTCDRLTLQCAGRYAGRARVTAVHALKWRNQKIYFGELKPMSEPPAGSRAPGQVVRGWS